jgi:predicted transcriptional regulator
VANRLPDANAQTEMSEQQARKQNLNASNTEHKRQFAADSANLLKLATELKAEVDKTNKDMLSVTVIRKADAIEKLARQVKEKMKRTAGAS